MLEKSITPVTAVLALVAAFVNLFQIPTTARIVAVAACCVIFCWRVAKWLGRTQKKPEETKLPTGFEISSQKPSRAKKQSKPSHLQKIGIALMLGLMAGAVVVLLGFTTVFHNVVLSEAFNGGRQTMLVRAPHVNVSELILIFPADVSKKCHPFDPVQGHRASVVLDDWESPNPKIPISDFSFPEQFGLRCSPHLQVSEIRTIVKPTSIQVLREQDLASLQCWFKVGGVILWLVTLLAAYLGSRS